jgi:hypothetical protein
VQYMAAGRRRAIALILITYSSVGSIGRYTGSTSPRQPRSWSSACPRSSTCFLQPFLLPAMRLLL